MMILLFLIPVCFMFIGLCGLYFIYKNCSDDELIFVEKYFNSYNINEGELNER